MITTPRDTEPNMQSQGNGELPITSSTTESTSEIPSTSNPTPCERVMPHFETCARPDNNISYSSSPNNSSEQKENKRTNSYQNFLTFVETLAKIPDSTMDVLGIQLDDLILDCLVAGQQCSKW